MFENKKICRTCLTSERELLSIFASVETGTRISDYFKLYLNHSLYENDGLPQKICLYCLHKILEIKKFYRQFRDSEEHLRRQMEKVTSSTTTEIIGLFEENEIKSEEVSEVSETEGFSCEETNSDDIIEYDPLETITFPSDDETSFVDVEEDPLEVEEFKCSLCNETFKYEKNLRMHIKRDHSDEEIEKSHSKNTNSPSDTSKRGTNTTDDNDRIQRREEHNQVHLLTSTDESSLCSMQTNSEDRERYRCHICDTTFLGKHSLACHLWIHIGQKPYKCDICRNQFAEPNALVTHMILHSENMIKCPLCDKYFRASYLKIHIRKHNDERPYECDMCPKRYKQKAHLVAHQYTHFGTKPFSCKTCGRRFKQRSYLQQHIFTHTGRPYKCPACVLTFVRPHKLREHLVSAHRIYDDPIKYKQQFNTNNNELKEAEQVILDADLVEMDDQASSDEETSFVDVEGEPLEVEEFKCSLCDQTFKYGKNLRMHIKRDHSDGKIEKSHSENTNSPSDTSKRGINPTNDDGRIQGREEHFNQVHLVTSTDERCSTCGAHFDTRKNLVAHMLTHSEDKKRYPCHICEKTFLRKDLLACHLWIHTGEKPFQCDICQRGFTQLNALATHMTLHIGKTVKCPLCDKCFHTSSLKVHIREHANERSYACDMCPKRYKQRSHLVAHQYTHFGAKPFSCETCGKCFKQRSYLQQHIFTHIGRPYKCPACALTFVRPYKLRQHLASAHGIYDEQFNTNNDELKEAEQVILEADLVEMNDQDIEIDIANL